MNEDCPICLVSLTIGSSHSLTCNHAFHSRCIRVHYYANKDKFLEDTFEHLTPTCPICRKRIRAKDLPSYKPKTFDDLGPSELERITTPAYASMSEDERPLRLVRRAIIIEREERRQALDRLLAERERLDVSRRAASNEVQQPTPAVYQRSPTPLRSVSTQRSSSSQELVGPKPSTSAQSSEQVEFKKASQDDRERPSYSVPDPPSPVGWRSWIDQSADRLRSMSPPTQENCPVLQIERCHTREPSAEFQEIEMQIGILNYQLNTIAQASQTEVLIDLEDDDVSVIDENDDTVAISSQPIKIVGRTEARGRYTHYKVLWADGIQSLHHVNEVKRMIPDLLRDFQRRNRAKNTRLCRERKKLARSNNV